MMLKIDNLHATVAGKPIPNGLSLSGVYAIWVLVVALMYPFCRWVAGVKSRRRDWWLSYL